MSQTPILEMRNISKTFGAVRALKDVSLTVYPAELHALMGENGAGKSTLMKILSGAYIADPGGTITIEGKPQAEAKGAVAVIYQELSLAPNLTVAENIYLGREPSKGGQVDRAGMKEGCADVLQRLGATFEAETIVNDLSIAERQMVEIARAVHANARILVMDEPTAGVDIGTKTEILDIVREFASQGNAVVFISSELPELLAVADRIVVIREGRSARELARFDVESEEQLQLIIQGEAA